MEGINMLAILAGYVAVLGFALTSLVALGLLIARYTRPARFVFAGGLLTASLIAALAVLSFFMPGYYHDGEGPLVAVTAASILLAGSGPFIAAFRGTGTYWISVSCSAVAILLYSSPVLAGDWSGRILGALGQRLSERGVPVASLMSLVPAAASVVVAIVPRGASAPEHRLPT